MNQQIVSRWDSSKVLFECEVPDDVPSSLAMRHALEKAAAQRPRLDFRGAFLRDADLRDANLSGADLSGADLSGANFRGAFLRGADFRGADFRGADLRDADLRDANLSDADFRGAALRYADFRYADFRDADLRDADGKQLPRATPEQAIENLDKVREIVLDDEARLNMGHWHGSDEWRNRTCAEETLCGTTHCMAGWLQVCTTEQALKGVNPQLAGMLAAPIASKMFHRDNAEALEWLRDRKYVAETAAYEKRYAELDARREAAKAQS